MKALPLVLLALALGAGLLYLVLDSGGPNRGSRGAPESSTSAAPVAPTPAPGSDAPQAGPAPRSLPDAPRRQSVDSAPTAEVHLSYEGVVIAEGAPLPGAEVRLQRLEELLGESKSDERGHFRIAIAPRQEGLVLRVRARGFVPIERKLVPKSSGGVELLGNVRLIRGQRLAGRVVDARGSGIADADLRAEPVNAGGDLLRARGRSGPDGNFEVADAPPGTVLVTARAKGFGERAVPHAPGAPLEIRLEAGLDLRLRLRTPRGEPVVGAVVSIQLPSAARVAARTEVSDGEGRVLFEGLSERSWIVQVTHPDFRPPGKSRVQVSSGEETLECTPWPAIEGIVQAPDGSPPPAGTKVQALPAMAPGDRGARMTGGREVDASGHFRLSGLRPGDWTVRVVAPGFAPTTSPPVKLGIEGNGYAGTILLDAGGQLSVQITSQGQPAVGAEVGTLSAAPTAALLWALQSSGGAGLGQLTRSGPDGRATIENLPPGQVWVAILAEGCPPTSSGPHQIGARNPAPIVVDLPRGARIRGRVLTKEGAPFPEAQLRITDRTGRPGFPLTLASNDEGRYTSAWLFPGHYTVEAFVPAKPTLRSGPMECDIEPGEQRELDLSL